LAVTGATYRPLEEIVPTAAFPAAIPLISQVTAGLLLPIRLAANCSEPPAATFADAGVILIEGGGGGGGLVFPPPHPLSAQTSSTISASPIDVFTVFIGVLTLVLKVQRCQVN
jgi:hypothetical protein